MLERVRTVGAREPRSVLSLEQNAIQYTIPYVKLELALLLSCSQRLLFWKVYPSSIMRASKRYPEHYIYAVAVALEP